MTAKQWKTKIKKACTDIGTYDKSFDLVIDALSDILEKRDSTLNSYDGNPVVSHTNSHGETNMAKNPALMLWLDCDKLALAYWRELGLTPSAYKKMTGGKPVEEKGSTLEAVLAKLGAG